jgi:hypothetical protein
MLVLTTGNGVNGFTLDPTLGEFILTHKNIRIPEKGRCPLRRLISILVLLDDSRSLCISFFVTGSIYAINEGNTALWFVLGFVSSTYLPHFHFFSVRRDLPTKTFIERCKEVKKNVGSLNYCVLFSRRRTQPFFFCFFFVCFAVFSLLGQSQDCQIRRFDGC